MIETVYEVNNVGLLRRAVPGESIALGTSTLVYAENARGKSTLAAILRAFASQDAQAILDRKNWQSDEDPLIKFGVGGGQAVFADGSWHGSPERIAVFDMRFVEDNVHSGWSLRADHRQRLYRFVLGEEAGALDRSYREADDAEKEANTAVRAAQDALKGYQGSMTPSQYARMTADRNIDTKLKEAERRKQQATDQQAILRRPPPGKTGWTVPDLSSFWTVLERSYESVGDDAEERVRTHIKSLPGEHGEAWVEAGMGHTIYDECPFCAQPLSGSTLVPLYRQYFDEEYRKLRDQAAALSALVTSTFPQGLEGSLEGAIERNTERAEAWRDAIDIALPEMNLVQVQSAISAIRDRLTTLAAWKKSAPLEAIDVREPREYVEDQLALAFQATETYERGVLKAVEQIDIYKQQLEKTTPEQVEEELVCLRRTKERFSRSVEKLVDTYNDTIAVQRATNQVKAEALKKLNDHATQVFANYHEQINCILTRFGAGYTLGTCTDHHKGGIKRVEFVLDFKGVPVGFVGEELITPGKNFGEALSEGDKRTLALAFFLARILRDPHLRDTVVVLDDPICSLGRYRRRATIWLLAELQTRCRQLIVLCHDEHFLRELMLAMREKNFGGVKPTCLGLDVAADGGSVLDACDLDRLCASPYNRDYRLVRDYVENNGCGDHCAVHLALRPVAEGYLKRRWVGRFDNCDGLGAMLGVIRSSDTDGEFAILKHSLELLSRLNEFAREAHHGPDDSSSWRSITAQEVCAQATSLMNFVYGKVEFGQLEIVER